MPELKHQIKWDSFTGNVKNYIETEVGYSGMNNPLTATVRQMLDGYLYTEDDEDDGPVFPNAADGDRWAQPSAYQPIEHERNVLIQLMFTMLMKNDSDHFWESIEGDYCMWNINIASRLERDELMTDGDWVLMCGAYLSLCDENYGAEPDAPYFDSLRKLMSFNQPLVHVLMGFQNHRDNIVDARLC